MAWWMPGEAVAEQSKDRRLVERCKVLDAVAESTGDEAGIVGEPSDDVARQPSTAVLEGLREVPVVEAKPRLNTARQHAIDQSVIKGQAGLVGCASALGQDARPGGRKPVGLHTKPVHQLDVLGVAVVVIAGTSPVSLLAMCPASWL